MAAVTSSRRASGSISPLLAPPSAAAFYYEVPKSCEKCGSKNIVYVDAVRVERDQG